MVLLESIWGDNEGRYAGETEDGNEIRIIGVPYPAAIGVFGREHIELELERLKKLARVDNSKIYMIQSEEEILKNGSNQQRVFAIGYSIFIK